MRWFKHDSNAHGDAKMKKVRNKFGIHGYGLYLYCLERISTGVDRNNITFELEEDVETIADEWRLDPLLVQSILEYMVHVGLFEITNGRLTCFKLAKRLDATNSKNPEIKRILSLLASQNSTNPNTPNYSEILGDTPTNSELLGDTPTNLSQIRLEEIRLDINTRPKETRPIASIDAQADNKLSSRVDNDLVAKAIDKFDEFYEVYGKKKKKSAAAKAWKAKIKTVQQADQVINHVKHRVKKDPDWLKENGQFKPYPSTFLNQELWLDEYQQANQTQSTSGYGQSPLIGDDDE